jgi:hypothetical protein
MTNASYNVGNKRIEVYGKYFIDDMEKALNLDQGTHFTPEMDSTLHVVLSEYMAAHFSMHINQQKCRLTMIGYELEEDLIWVYLESEELENFERIEVMASQLTETFDEQHNIVSFEKEGITRSDHFTKDKSTGLFNFADK